MECPNCEEHVSARRIFNTRSRLIDCEKCGVRMRVTGFWWFSLTPLLAFSLFPFGSLPDSLLWSTLILAASVVLAYFVAFRAFVRLVKMESQSPKDSGAAAPPPGSPPSSSRLTS
jgi:hypothetical protein